MSSAEAVVEPTTASRRPVTLTAVVPAVLLVAAAVGWWWSVQMADEDMGMIALGPFLLAWFAMMAAMMLPAITPVVKLYGLAAAKGRAAPLPFFVSGYLVVWTAVGIPAYFASQALMMPLEDAMPWAARLAGGVLLGAAVYQLSPLKDACLRHCRTPLGFFLRLGRSVGSPPGAVRAGVMHGAVCLGCCWALMAVLVSLGTMNLIWMIGLALLIFLEKNASFGVQVARAAAVAMAGIGMWLLIQPSAITTIT